MDTLAPAADSLARYNDIQARIYLNSSRLVDDAVCSLCKGHGHWAQQCYVFRGTSARLCGLPVAAPEGESEQSLPRFHLELPWLALRPVQRSKRRPNQAEPEYEANTFAIPVPDRRFADFAILAPNTYNDAVMMCVDFMEHLTDYETVRKDENKVFHLVHLWLAHQDFWPRKPKANKELLAFWNKQAEAFIEATRVLVRDIANLIRKFEKDAIIIPIGKEIMRLRKDSAVQSQQFLPPLSSNRNADLVAAAVSSPLPGVSKEVFYSQVWGYITSSDMQEFERRHPLDPLHFQNFMASVNIVRARYLRKENALTQENWNKVFINLSYRQRQYWTLNVAFGVPRMFMIKIEEDDDRAGNAADGAGVRSMTFEWPNAHTIAGVWRTYRH